MIDIGNHYVSHSAIKKKHLIIQFTAVLEAISINVKVYFKLVLYLIYTDTGTIGFNNNQRLSLYRDMRIYTQIKDFQNLTKAQTFVWLMNKWGTP